MCSYNLLGYSRTRNTVLKVMNTLEKCEYCCFPFSRVWTHKQVVVAEHLVSSNFMAFVSFPNPDILVRPDGINLVERMLNVRVDILA